VEPELRGNVFLSWKNEYQGKYFRRPLKKYRAPPLGAPDHRFAAVPASS
jgi:hypothetical protein